MNRILSNTETSDKVDKLYEKIIQDKDNVYRSIISEIKSSSEERINDYKDQIEFLKKEKIDIQVKYDKAILDLSKSRIESIRASEKASRYDQLSDLLSKLIDKLNPQPAQNRIYTNTKKNINPFL
ncbi:MAG: hypothetical protein CFH01_00110 [Alphaproteobacteria bacterium MarineAlpha2_Bin1]|nr:MAG: hypothetical protein CFH01_00110 [Alphaproteobacteria bacterium MarineAlpha2_Bin1]|tara:strand:+ start:289 stop:663 length:375 start_codon:yes stop_codon:yes gene_type:complete